MYSVIMRQRIDDPQCEVGAPPCTQAAHFQQSRIAALFEQSTLAAELQNVNPFTRSKTFKPNFTERTARKLQQN